MGKEREFVDRLAHKEVQDHNITLLFQGYYCLTSNKDIRFCLGKGVEHRVEDCYLKWEKFGGG